MVNSKKGIFLTSYLLEGWTTLCGGISFGFSRVWRFRVYGCFRVEVLAFGVVVVVVLVVVVVVFVVVVEDIEAFFEECAGWTT